MKIGLKSEMTVISLSDVSGCVVSLRHISWTRFEWNMHPYIIHHALCTINQSRWTCSYGHRSGYAGSKDCDDVAYQRGESESFVSPAHPNNHDSDTNPTALREAKNSSDTNVPSTKELVPNGRTGRPETSGNMNNVLRGLWLVTVAIPRIKDTKINLLGEFGSRQT